MLKSRLTVYVTGLYEGVDGRALERRKQELSLVCRRILIADHTPLCVVTEYELWRKDPRLAQKGLGWWIEHLFEPVLRACDVFCSIRVPIGIESKRLDMEMDCWRRTGTGKFVPSDVILDHLLEYNATRLLR